MTQIENRTEGSFKEIIGESTALLPVLSDVETVATADSTVLIHGERGTRKELIARLVHNLSSRKARGFVTLNCVVPMPSSP